MHKRPSSKETVGLLYREVVDPNWIWNEKLRYANNP